MTKKEDKKKAPAKKAGAKVEKEVTVDGVTFKLEKYYDTGRLYWKSPLGWKGTYATEAEAMKDKPC